MIVQINKEEFDAILANAIVFPHKVGSLSYVELWVYEFNGSRSKQVLLAMQINDSFFKEC